MGDEEQGKAHVVPQLQQQLLHAAAGQRVQRGEGLIHQEHTRLHGQRAGNSHTLLHPARQLVWVRVGEPAQPHLVDVVQGAFLRGRAAQRA